MHILVTLQPMDRMTSQHHVPTEAHDQARLGAEYTCLLGQGHAGVALG